MQRIANLVVLEKCCKMRIWMQKSASMQKRTSPLKFAHLAEKSGFNSVPNLSTEALPELLLLARTVLQQPSPPPQALAVLCQRVAEGLEPGLKDPIGKRSDKSNFRHQKSVKILPEFENICWNPLEMQQFYGSLIIL